MSRPVISVENLCKAYRIGLKEEIPDTLMSAVASVARAPWKNLQRLRRLNTFSDDVAGPEKEDTLWALKDVSFQVRDGEVLGIIGRNGAGKSTLLKILSRITEPTSGRIRIKGRVSSLLEVGTGFHPELSGRENIYMNGTILGMTKAEIDRKFDEIVDFSGVEKFLDTPVKRYSSGMKVRLAFAVAAHLEPEILIIDEVLAVGDAEFQKRCLGKMQDVATGGRTVLFVSHNMAAVTGLCSQAIVLRGGSLERLGDVDDAVDYYNTTTVGTWGTQGCDLSKTREKRFRPYITSVRVSNLENSERAVIPLGGPLRIDVAFATGNNAPLRSPTLGVGLTHTMKGPVAHVNTRMTGFSLQTGHYRNGTLTCLISSLPLLPGQYTIDIWLGDGPIDVDVLRECLYFEVAPTDYYNTGKLPPDRSGTTLLDAEWAYDQ